MAKSGNYGFSSLNQNLNSPYFNNYSSGDTKGKLIPAKVISIVLNESHPRFKELGEWNALGAIEYDFISSPSSRSQGYPVAYPVTPNIKNYPLINETVNILVTFSGDPDSYNPNTLNNPKYKTYYFGNINLWNHPHHNAFSFTDDTPSSQNKSVSQTQAGSSKNVSDDPKEIYLGKTFKERPNIHPLLPFEGDVIYEGRWGNSIRFGSTVTASLNLWSTTGSNGDPITIIRNGEDKQTDSGWVPILEDINTDDSSIYLTSTQQIPIDADSKSYVSYPKDEAPLEPSKYVGAQIILNSGRLVFNSNLDHILLSAAKSINLNSQVSVNIDATKFTVQANKIYLGQNEASEPLMLGTQTVNLLTDLINALTSFMKIAETATTNLIPFPDGSTKNVTLPTINSSATDVLYTLKNLNDKLKKNNLISKRNFTV